MPDLDYEKSKAVRVLPRYYSSADMADDELIDYNEEEETTEVKAETKVSKKYVRFSLI